MKKIQLPTPQTPKFQQTKAMPPILLEAPPTPITFPENP
jgi:hypothetical protein